MKNIVLIIIYLFVNSALFSQNCDDLLLLKADKLYREKNAVALFQLYDSIALYPKPTVLSYTTALECAIELRDTIRMKKYLQLAILNQDFNSKENLKYNFPSLGNLININPIIQSFDSLFVAWSNTFNSDISKTIDEIIIKDKYIRSLTDMHSNDSLLLTILNYTDSINERALYTACQSVNRFPGVAEIGKYRLGTLGILSVHFIEKMDTSFYFPMIKRSILDNNINNEFVTNVIDRVRYRFDRPTLYGVITSERGSDVKYFYPIEDIENVDARRAYFCLPPLIILKSQIPNLQLPPEYEEK